MKLLFITRKFPPIKGGMEKAAYDLYHSISEYSDAFLMKPSSKFRGAFAVTVLSLMSFRRLLKKDIDIIYLQDGMLSPLIMIGKIYNIPVVITTHGLDVTFGNSFYQALIRFFLPKANKIVCVSRATSNACIERGVNPNKISIIPNGIREKELDHYIDSDAPPRDSNDIVLLSVGRLVERKGYHWFISSVMPRLVGSNLKIKYYIVGNGPMREEIQSRITNNKLDKNIELLGAIDNATLYRLYRSSDIFISPNILVANDMEGFGITNIEAPFFGTPVVASNIEGIMDAVEDGVTGTLVQPDDEAGFFSAIMDIISGKRKFDPIEMKKFISDSYSWSTIAQDYIGVFKNIVQNRH